MAAPRSRSGAESFRAPPGECQRQLFVIADDFGRSPEINDAIIRAHREGPLTGASLMVGGDAAEQAVAMARQTPSLAVGLHVVLVDGHAVLPHSSIPHLVDRGGRFLSSPTRAGLRYFASRAARGEMVRELAAQFERFRATGLPLAHVDGHLHMHLHPAVFEPLVVLCQQHGACRMRIPRDSLLLSLRVDRRRAVRKVGSVLVFALLCRWCLKRLGARVPVTDRGFGLMQSGHMGEAYVLRLLDRLGDCSAEIYFHPTTGSRLDALGPNPGDLETLVSPAVRSAICRRRASLAGRPDRQP